MTQTQLSTFREELKKQQSQPNTYLLKAAKVPYSLLRDSQQGRHESYHQLTISEGKVNLLEVESFDSTFGKKRTRKRPRLSSYTMEALAAEAQSKEDGYKVEDDVGLMEEEEFKVTSSIDYSHSSGQTQRCSIQQGSVSQNLERIVQSDRLF